MAHIRKTKDEYQIHGYYYGTWEEATCSDNWKEARQLLKDYRTNVPHISFKVVTKRVPLTII